MTPVRLAKALFDGRRQARPDSTQVRRRHGSLLRRGREVLEVCSAATPTVIVNDRADVARVAGASGVHLGQEDLPPSLARSDSHGRPGYRMFDSRPFTGPGGGSAPRWTTSPLDPVFATSTKENAAPVLGLERLREICSRVRKPVVAIGGITLDSAREVFDCGATSVAVIGDLLKHGNVADRTRDWVRHLES